MVQLTYPGVYVQEIPSGVQTITGVSTSIVAFVDSFSYGPMNKPTLVQSWSEFERYFGGLDANSISSYGIQQFFINGGSQAYVVRVGTNAAAKSHADFGTNHAVVRARNEGSWGDRLRIRIENLSGTNLDLIVERVHTEESDKASVGAKIVASEKYMGLSTKISDPRSVYEVLKESSELIELDITGVAVGTTEIQGLVNTAFANGVYTNAISLESGANSGPLTADIVTAGVTLLEKVDLFNILCLPIAAESLSGNAATLYASAKVFCEKKRAFLLVDIPAGTTHTTIDTYKDTTLGSNAKSKNAAIFFPRVIVADPLNSYRPKSIPASGSIAGLFSRIDGTRGVWKAPAGVEALINGIVKLDEEITDDQNGVLNPKGINCLRRFPVYGTINWGARTLIGSDQEGSEWKYIPVRRLALYIEESLFRGTKWVVFEPNDEPLWAQIRQSVGAFMMDLFRQGAFQGSTPSQAYYVRCDGTTTLPLDRERGVVNIEVGFAPLKPAEFVVLKFQQIAATANS